MKNIKDLVKKYKKYTSLYYWKYIGYDILLKANLKVRAITSIELFNSNDFRSISDFFTDKQLCKQYVDRLKSCAEKDYLSDFVLFPWCAVVNNCYDCAYCKEHSKCADGGSHYLTISEELYNKMSKKNIIDIPEVKVTVYKTLREFNLIK